MEENKDIRKVLKSGCGRRNSGGGAVAVAGCKGRSVTVAVTGTVNFFIFRTICKKLTDTHIFFL